MGKPTGLALELGVNGGLEMEIVRSSRTTDMIWDAVEDAVISGMEPKQFLKEAEEAWAASLKKAAEDQMKQWPK